MKKKAVHFFLFFSAMTCFGSISAQVSKSAIDNFLNDSTVKTGHAGISIYDPATGKYLYNYNAEKNFLPSSNTKLFTLYAGMKYLGDSLVGIRYKENDTAIYIMPTGDPTLLHPDFKSQPVIDFLSSSQKTLYANTSDIFDDMDFSENRLGKGWVWDDYEEDFMAERSVMPIYGNVQLHIPGRKVFSTIPQIKNPTPGVRIILPQRDKHKIARNIYSNNFVFFASAHRDDTIKIPFITSESLSFSLLSDTIHKSISFPSNFYQEIKKPSLHTIYSRPVDSLFRPMMFNSDNFFAEQTLLMVSNEKLGYMNDEDIIDTLLKNDFKDIPTKPRWVDGSGLSRYNLFSPKDFIYILVKLKNEFGWERIKNILPAGGEGTLAHYYKDRAQDIHAKTGSMSNNVSQSGYITTKKGKTLLFSVIINNFTGSETSGRKAIERFIRTVIDSN